MAVDPLKASPRLTYFPAAHSSGPRPASAIDFIVLHSTEGSTPEGAASWFHSPASAASTQLVVGNDVSYRCVPDLTIPWAAPGANTHGLHIEHTGFARYTWSTWMLKHRNTLKRSAYQAAKAAKKYGIPVVWLSPADLKAGKKGFTSHLNCSKAFGGDHTDPGSGFPRWYYLNCVKGYLKGM